MTRSASGLLISPETRTVRDLSILLKSIPSSAGGAFRLLRLVLHVHTMDYNKEKPRCLTMAARPSEATAWQVAEKKGRGISAPATRQSSVLQLVLEVVGRKPPKHRDEYTCLHRGCQRKSLFDAVCRIFARNGNRPYSAARRQRHRHSPRHPPACCLPLVTKRPHE